jgi:hypothetical protein
LGETLKGAIARSCLRRRLSLLRGSGLAIVVELRSGFSAGGLRWFEPVSESGLTPGGWSVGQRPKLG